MQSSYQAFLSQFGSGRTSASAIDSNLPGDRHTLHKAGQHLTTGLQEWMPHDNLEEPLQPFPPVLDDIIAEPVGENLTRQRRNSHPCALSLEDISEVLKVGISPSHNRVLDLKGRDIGAADDLVVRVHCPAETMGLRIFHFNFEEVLGDTVDFLERLDTGFWHGLHDDGSKERVGAERVGR